jgi:hypothetical protein
MHREQHFIPIKIGRTFGKAIFKPDIILILKGNEIPMAQRGCLEKTISIAQWLDISIDPNWEWRVRHKALQNINGPIIRNIITNNHLIRQS